MRSWLALLILAVPLAAPAGTAQVIFRPDLVLAGVTITPSSPVEGAPWEVCVAVENRGKGLKTAPFQVEVLVDGRARASAESPGLEPGGAVELCRAEGDLGTLRAGPHSLGVRVDARDEIEEGAEDNNEALEPISVRPAPRADLRVASFEAPAHAEGGGAVAVAARVVNAGNLETGTFVVKLLLDGGEARRERAGPLGVGAEQDLRWDLPTRDWATGPHELELVVDADDEVRETREQDNGATATIEARAWRADLAVAWAVSQAPRVGDAMDLRARVENVGPGRAGPFEVRFFVDDASAGADRVAGLEPGGAVNVSVRWLPSAPGPARVLVVADARGDVAEESEGNNRDAATLRVAPAPEPAPPQARALVLDDARFRDGEMTAGRPTAILLKLANPAGAESSARVHLRVNGAILAARQVGVPASGIAEVAFDWTPPAAGEFRFQIEIEPEGEGAAPEPRLLIAEVARDGPEPDPAPSPPPAEPPAKPRPEPSAKGVPEPPPKRQPPLPEPPDPSKSSGTAILAVEEFRVDVDAARRPPIRLNVVVRNAGDAPASDVHVSFQVDGVDAGGLGTPWLSPGKRFNVTTPWDGDAGLHVARVEVIAAGGAGAAVASAPGETVREFRAPPLVDAKAPAAVPGPAVLAAFAGLAVAAVVARRRR